MRKVLILLVAIMGLFFTNINIANAAKFNYDIDSITVSGGHLVIKGWGAIISGITTPPSHHYNPNYTLNIVNESGATLFSVNNSLARSADVDFSLPYYVQRDPYNHYRLYGSAQERAAAIKATETRNPDPNNIYINITFVFNVPINQLQQHIPNGPLMFNLVMSQGGIGSRTIFGSDFNVKSWSYTIPRLGAINRVISPSVNQLGSFQLIGATDKVTVIVTSGVVQGCAALGSCPRSGTIYTYNGNYTVYGIQTAADTISNYAINVYQVGCTGSGAPGGGNVCYIPAYWRNPYQGSYLQITEGDCGRLPCYIEGTKKLMCNISTTASFSHPANPADAVTPPGTMCPPSLQPCAENFEQGILVHANTACYIRCNEALNVHFQSSPSVRAGMGFEYPIAIDGTRKCKAVYTNDTWVSSMNNNVNSAVSNYNCWQTNTETANKISSDCGSPAVTDKVSPTCPAGCIRSGGSCSCTRNCTVCGRASPLLCKTCTVDVTCPRNYSYNTSSGYCEVKLCPKNDALWDATQRQIDGLLRGATTCRNDYNTNVLAINTLNADRLLCDTTWRATNKYNANPSIQGTLETSRQEENLTYVETSKGVGVNMTDVLFRRYNPVYETESYTVLGKPRLRSINMNPAPYYTNWTEVSNLSATYEFDPYYCVRKYDAKLLAQNPPCPSGYYDGGRKYYTDFRERSGSYDLNVSVSGLGPNIPPGNPIQPWHVDMDCSYSVDNKIFPPPDDPNYPDYGNLAFSVRHISLTDPFPRRSARENWRGHEGKITSKGYSVYADTPLFQFRLSPANLLDIRRENRLRTYSSFRLDEAERSYFIRTLNSTLGR